MAKQICAVEPEQATLPELERVLRAGGYVAVIEDRLQRPAACTCGEKGAGSTVNT